MEEEKKEKEKETLDLDKTCEVIEDKLKELTESGYKQEVSKYWGDTVDILKDIYEIKLKKEGLNMYQGYGNSYGRGYGEDSLGRGYGEDFGARGVPGTGAYRENYGRRRRYRGDDSIDDMKEEYQKFMGEKEYGRYGSPEEEKSFKYMVKALKDFSKHIAKEASSPEQKEMIKQAAREVMEDV